MAKKKTTKSKAKKIDELSQEKVNDWIAWEAPEFESYQRTWVWTFLVLFVAFTLIITFFQMKDYSAMAVVVAGTIVFVQQARAKPKNLRYALRNDGFTVGEKTFSWRELKSFWIIENNSSTHLYLETTARWLPLRTILLRNIEPAEVRARLQQHLPERTTRGEQFNELLARILRF